MTDVAFGLLIADTFDRQLRGLLDPFLVGQHRDRIPRAVFGAERAADTALDIDLHHLLELGEIHARNNLDTIHRAKIMQASQPVQPCWSITARSRGSFLRGALLAINGGRDPLRAVFSAMTTPW